MRDQLAGGQTYFIDNFDDNDPFDGCPFIGREMAFPIDACVPLTAGTAVVDSIIRKIRRGVIESATLQIADGRCFIKQIRFRITQFVKASSTTDATE